MGRDVYSEKEKIAWSIVVATKGRQGFVDELLNSDEYLDSFGYDIVPYQRRRNLASREQGEIPFNIKSPRYDGYYRGILGFPQVVWQNQIRRFTPQETKVGEGNPSLFLNMARNIKSPVNPAPRVSAFKVDLSQVPYR